MIFFCASFFAVGVKVIRLGAYPFFQYGKRTITEG
jgi:hypothetical protein